MNMEAKVEQRRILLNRRKRNTETMLSQVNERAWKLENNCKLSFNIPGKQRELS